MHMRVRVMLQPPDAPAALLQALNMDAARFYELYHASRESFLYVRHFYIGAQLTARAAAYRTDWHRAGEVAPQDRALVPQPQPGPSEDFLEQLRLFTPFRLPVSGAYKSF